jgi:hypothetical protein
MKISLKQLNDSFPALVRLCQQSLPKEKHKLTYQLAKLFAKAKSEMEIVTDSLNDLMVKCGLFDEPSQEKNQVYNKMAGEFLKTTEVDLYGSEILIEEIIDHVTISPHDLALLDWLIVLEEEKVTTEKETKFYEWPIEEKN